MSWAIQALDQDDNSRAAQVKAVRAISRWVKKPRAYSAACAFSASMKPPDWRCHSAA